MKKIFLIGCGGMVAFISIVVFLVYWGMTTVTTRFVEELTSENPVTLPVSEFSDHQKKVFDEKMKQFRNAHDIRKEMVIEMDKDEFNHWLKEMTSEPLKKFPRLPEWNEMVYTHFTNNLISAQVSVPLDPISDFIFLKAAKGRYFNGNALFEPRKNDQGLYGLQLVGLTVNGERVAPDKLKSVHTKKSYKDWSGRPEVHEWVSSLKAVEVRDGKIILTTRAADQQPETAVEENQ